MRFIAVVLSVYALVFASGALAETSSDKSDKQNATQHENVEGEHLGWYTEKVPYRPCPAVAAINGHNLCLGCPWASAGSMPKAFNACALNARRPVLSSRTNKAI